MAEAVQKAKQATSPVHEFARKLMGDYYGELKNSIPGGGKAGYLMISGNCVEILRSFGMPVVFPEVNALQLAIRKQSLPFILKAEQIGYSSDNCAYVKADMGMQIAQTTQNDIPAPAVLVCNYVGCNVYVKWFEHLAEYYKCPLIMIDIPFLRETAPMPEDTKYVITQLKRLIAKCEELTGKKFDIDRLREVVSLSAKAEEGWANTKDLCKHVPSPFDAYFDSINMMAPINVLRGSAAAVEFFGKAYSHYKSLTEVNQSPAGTERFRIVIEGPPPYPYYRNFRELFERWGAVAVQSTYSTVGGIWEFGFRHDPKHPLESIAEQMLVHNLCNQSILRRYDLIRRYIEEWRADAFVIHSVKSCRLFSAGQGDMREFFVKELSVPTLMLESDLEDPRYYADAQMRNRIDAFFESLAARKGNGSGARK